MTHCLFLGGAQTELCRPRRLERTASRDRDALQPTYGSNRLGEAAPNQWASHDKIDLDCSHFAQPYYPDPSADSLEKNALERMNSARFGSAVRGARCGYRAANPPASCASYAQASRREKISEARTGGGRGFRFATSLPTHPRRTGRRACR
jgi:hypothetical protein